MTDALKKNYAIVYVISVCVLFLLLCNASAIAQSIDIVVSGNINNMQLTPGNTNENSSVYLMVTTSDAGSWSVSVSNPPLLNPYAAAGHMAEYNETS